MATMVDLTFAGRTYQVACREGEEDNLRAAARLVDGKSREALAGLGTLSEARQFLFASLLLADQLIDDQPDRVPAEAPTPDPALGSALRAAFAARGVQVSESPQPLRQTTDHGTHLAIYISDPDGNDLELCWDRPPETWPRDADGHLAFADGELDLDDLLVT